MVELLQQAEDGGLSATRSANDCTSTSELMKNDRDLPYCYSVASSVKDIRPLLENLMQRSQDMVRSNDVAEPFQSNGGTEISSEASTQAMMTTISSLDISLFSDVIHHCLRISRALCHDATHAMIVGISGTGKQSIAN